ncbi:MAG: glycosyltransferase family 2 protein [Bacteroidales bacterium]|nr:glycosyltransferase family 2 protein [Bacteroidales bacterium]
MFKTAFVILHYETLSDTVECVNSILSVNRYPEWQIVVVDNGSVNQSGHTLKETYKDNARIHVLLNGENLGFARGNNAGYRYAKEKLHADFIIVINNDTLLRQPDFIETLLTRYNRKKFDILGPDILSLKDGSHQNPRKEVLDSVPVVKKYIRYFRVTLLLNYLFIDNFIIGIKKFFIPSSTLPSATQGKINPDNLEMEQVKLHGSALVFSPDYLKKYDVAFYPETFLYCEESILFYFVRKDKLTTVYYPALSIVHKEDATSDYLYKKARLKRRFYLKNNLKSARVLLKLLKNL